LEMKQAFKMWCVIVGVGMAGTFGVHADSAAWKKLMSTGLAAADAGRFEDGKEAFERALAMAREDAPESTAVAASLNGIGACQRSLGEFTQAAINFEAALTIFERHFGAGDPKTLPPLNNLSGVYREQGDYERARPILERSLAIERKAYGDSSVSVGETRLRLGNVLEQSGRLAAAAIEFDTAIAIFKNNDSAEASNLLRAALAARGNLYREMGQL